MTKPPEIRFLKGVRLGERAPLSDSPAVVFGRAKDADVRVPDVMASKRHFRIERRGQALYVVDCGSTNGTRLNGEPVDEARVFHEDLLGIGATEIQILCPDLRRPSSTIHFLSSGDDESPPPPRPRQSVEMIRGLLDSGGGADSGLPARFLRILYDLSNLVSAEGDPGTLARKSLETVGETLEMQRGVLVDGGLQPLAGFSAWGSWTAVLEAPLRSALEEAVHRGVASRRVVALGSAVEDPDATRGPGSARVQILCAPLRGPEGPVGAVYLDRVLQRAPEPDDPVFSDAGLSVLALAGRQLGLALDRARLLREKGASDERYRILVENANDCIFLLDREGRFRFANSRAEAVFGAPPAEILGTTLLERLHPDLREGIRMRLDGALAGGDPQVFETETSGADGSRSILSVSLSAIGGGENPVLGIARDVTDERRMQDLVFQAERLASLGRLVAGAAHELNNPLTAVLGFSEILLRDTSLPREVLKRLRLVHEEGERARNIVSNLVAFARPPRSTETTLSVNDTLCRAVDLLSHPLRKNRIEVVLTLDEMAEIPGDPSLHLQVFLAVLTNALQAIEGEGRPGRIGVRSWRIEDEVHVAVSDSGPGIPAQHLKRVFDPFFTTREVGEGAGLGLSMCYRVVTGRGGRIHIASPEGEGTTVEIVLPAGP